MPVKTLTQDEELTRIDRRLSLAFLFGSIALFLVFGATFGAFVLASLHKERDRLSASPARLLGPIFINAHHDGDLRHDAEGAMAADSSILFVRMTDPSGVLLQLGPTPDDEAAALQGDPHGDVRLRELEVAGVHVTEATLPLVDGAWHGLLRLGVRSEAEPAAAARVVLGAMAVLVLLVAIAWLIARRLGKRFGTPVQELALDFAGILANTSLYLVIEDEEHRVVHASRTVRRSFDEQCVGRSTREVFGVAPGVRLDGDTEVSMRGTPRTLQFVQFPVSESRTGVVGTDVTDQRRTEVERVRLAAAIEATDDFVLVVREGQGVVYANPALLSLTGFVPGQVMARDPVELLSGDAEARRVLSVRLPENSWKGRIAAPRQGGAPWQCALSISPIEGSGFEVWVGRDVSREVDLESQLRQSQKLEAIGQLAGGVAHDFNNILTVVLSNTQALLSDELTADQREGIQMIDEAGTRASELTRQLLAFGRRQVLKVEEVKLGEVVTRSSSLLRRVIGASIELKTHVAQGLWSLKADAGQLEMVLMNLAINARDAMPQGGTLVVDVANATLGDTPTADGRNVVPGDHVLLRVADTGTGMSPETLHRIFEPFFTTKPIGRGTGLGLATVLGIVRQAGAFIWVDSELGRGSTFRIAFPRLLEREASVAVPVEPEAPRGRGQRVLLVEDEPLVCRALEQMLTNAGYVVSIAGDGLAAMAALDGGLKPDLILTDIVMPRMNGLDLRRVVLERMSVPVLLMSGYSAEVVELGGLDDAELLWKPPSRPAVLNAVSRALTR
jgi:signal transduction histidine kinase